MRPYFPDDDLARRIQAGGARVPDARELTMRAAQDDRDAQKVLDKAREAADSIQRSLERIRAADRPRLKSHASAEEIVARTKATLRRLR